MKATAVLLYGVLAYAAFLAAILYAIGFLGNFVVPKSIDSGEVKPLAETLVVNLLLLLLFAVQHTIMARPAFKVWWTRLIPRAMERSTFVLAASAVLGLLYWQWRPLTEVVWNVEPSWLRAVLWALFLCGWAIVFYTSFLIDHFDLFGLRQVVLYWRGKEYKHPEFVERSLYRWLRHPLMLGFLIAIWITPTMSQGHLLFAVVVTAYIFFGIMMEERDLLKILGEDYRQYRDRTSMIVPLPQKT